MATFGLLTCSLLQKMRSTDYYAAPLISRRSAVTWCISIHPLFIARASSCSLSGPLSRFRLKFGPWQTRTLCFGHIVADTNVSPFARARNVCCRHKFCVRTQKMFLILFRNILCPQQMFPSLCSPRNITGNNVSATINVSSFTRALTY